ncbi:MAG: carboxylesterase [Sphingomonas sp.]|nr:MAG: carboxylesterase [Sphingomonas sp.]
MGIAIASAAPAGTSTASPQPIVGTKEGRLLGQRSGGVDRFLGIAFAAPAQRWTPAARPTRWAGLRGATKSRQGCAAPNSGDGPESLNEDCLYLDIYRPAGVRRGARLPVIVFLHGGGNNWGSPAIYDGERIARVAGAIVVIPAYRLGPFGFLALAGGSEAARARGDIGVGDQIAALRWTADHIAAFGGDPAQVTLAGESAGAADVCALLATPAARGLFGRAVMQSGFCGNVNVAIGDAERIGAAVAREAGCEDRAPLLCLRAKPAGEILRAWAAVWGARRALDPMPLFPTIPYGTSTLPEMPRAAAEAGRIAPVPLLIGFDRDELRSMLGALLPLDAGRYRAMIARAYGPLAGAISQEYPASDGSPFDALAALRSDHLIICPSIEIATVFAHRNPVAMFEFSDRTAPPFQSLGTGGGKAAPEFNRGASHTVELQYLFGYRAAAHGLSADQQALADEMAHRWVRFARDGVTAPWKPFDRQMPAITRFALPQDGGIVVRNDIADEHRCRFWHDHDMAVSTIAP